MVTKVIFTLIFIGLALAGYFLIEQYLLPKSSADLAITQAQEDGSRELMRFQELAQNWWDPCYVAIGVCVVLFLWKKEIKKIVSAVVNKISNNVVVDKET